MNNVSLSGRLAQDPEIRSNGETKTAKYTLAVRRNFKTAQNVDWIQCTAFGRLAENAEKYLHKGMMLNVSGRIQTSTYTNKDGKKVYATEVIVGEQEFGESKREYEERIAKERAEEQTSEQTAQQEPVAEEPKQELPKKPSPDDWMNVPEGFDENDIPFA